MDPRFTPCPRCGFPTAGWRVYRSLPTPKLARDRRNGMCRACWNRRGAAPTGKRPHLPREVVVEEWRWLHEAGELTREDTFTHRIGQAAPRIGMSVYALEKALARAGITADTRDRDEVAA